jgi:hypothetical protein
VHDPLTTLFHSAHGGDVILTVVRGRTLYASGAVTTLDEPATLAAVEECAVRLRAVW